MELLPFFITGIGIEYEEHYVIRDQGYQDYQWSYCVSGEGVFKIGNKSYTITKGMAFFFKKGVPHSYEAKIKPWETEWITFNGVAVEKMMAYMGIGEMELTYVDREQDIKNRIREIYYTLAASTYLHERTLKTSGQLYEFLIFMRENMGKNKNEGKDKGYERLSPVINYMDTYYQQPITLEELAGQIGVTKYYLCRIFKETYQSKPFDYLNQIRIQKAKEYLVTQEHIKIKDIAEQVGFNDTSYFCLKFKEYEGCSPLEFKRRYSLS